MEVLGLELARLALERLLQAVAEDALLVVVQVVRRLILEVLRLLADLAVEVHSQQVLTGFAQE